MELHEIESHSRPPNTELVLSDLMSWLDGLSSESFAKLVNWQALDISLLQTRLENNPSTKPRIELTAHITKMNNLSVRWYPGGWKSSEYDWNKSTYHRFNLITQRKWNRPPDFHWFTGDEEPTFESRASNELMYIRGVGNLRPEPPDRDYGPYATYNRDVVDSILISAVRAAYEGLARQLEYIFEVDVIDVFDFEIKDEIDASDPSPYRSEVHRVVGWALKDAAELRKENERKAAIKREADNRAELANTSTQYGFSIEQFIEMLDQASSKKSTGPAPNAESLDRNAAKKLRENGFKIDAKNVRRLRQLIEEYQPETLPERLRPAIIPRKSTPTNIVPFPGTGK